MSKDLTAVLERYEIDTPARVSHFLAQVAEESQGFSCVVEQGSDDYFGRYDGRYGNKEPGDGAKYRGRGLIQLTFKDNYARVGKAIGVDLVSQPEAVADPHNYLLVSGEFWKENELNKICDKPIDDDTRIEAITRIVNGGLTGLAERKAYLSKIQPIINQLFSATGILPSTPPSAAVAVAPLQPPTSIPAQIAMPPLQHGSKGVGVKALETCLIERGYLLGSVFGVATQAAVQQFQEANKLFADGVVGPQTWAALLQSS